jgi:hypothetical protein
MIVKNLTRWIILAPILILTISGCSMMGTKEIKVSSAPIEIDIIQPTMPRAIDLKEPYWHVVSSAKIPNPCVKNEDGKRPRQKIDGVWVCDLGKENDWPAGYTYLDRFLDDVKKKNNGDVVFMAISVEDYELMAFNMQELRRYIREVQEVVVYYRNVTIKNPDGTSERGVGVSNGNSSSRPSVGIFPRDKKD